MPRPTKHRDPPRSALPVLSPLLGAVRSGLADLALAVRRRRLLAGVVALLLVVGVAGTSVALLATGSDPVREAAVLSTAPDQDAAVDDDRPAASGRAPAAGARSRLAALELGDGPRRVLRAGAAIERIPPKPEPVVPGLSDLAQAAEGVVGDETSCTPVAPATLTVATYNILGAGSRNGGGNDLSRVVNDLRAWDVDVAILQEVYRFGGDAARSDQPAQIASALGAGWAFGFNARKGGSTQYGTAIISRFPILEQANVALPNAGGGEPRGVLRATLDVGGADLDVFDTHLQPGADSLKQAQARTVAGVIGARRTATGNPAVLGGDFNSIPTNGVAGTLGSVLRDVWFDVGSGSGFTHPAGGPNARIDRLYHSPEVVPISAAVRPATASDHNAVTATVQVEGSGTTCP